MNMELRGTILKALSGFYYVSNGQELIECRGRGKLRRQGQTPLVGDRVAVTRSGGRGVIEQILPRKNALIRPAVANIDALVVLASAAIPVTEPFLIDRVCAAAAGQVLDVILCINKCDLDPAERLTAIYTHAGFPVVRTSAQTGTGVEELRELLRGKTVAFTGNSGVGKSSLLVRLCPELRIDTAEVSQKLGRGRHTTRHIELFDIGGGTFVADTPGFSAFDPEQTEQFDKRTLDALFPDFAPYLGGCRFQDCSHRKEPDCAVLRAVQEGNIEPSRHKSYLRLYELAAQRKDWENKQE